MSFYKESGNLILGSRLKRLSEKFTNEISLVYKHFNVHFETSWFPVFFLLNKNKILTLSQISEKLEISHSAVSQMISNLKKKGLVEILSDNVDERKKYIQLTTISKNMLPSLNKVWEVLENSITNQFASVAEQNRFFLSIDRLEDNLEEKKLSKDSIERMARINQSIRVLPYTIRYNKQLNEFLEKNQKSDGNLKPQDFFLAVTTDNLIVGVVAFKRMSRNVLINDLILDKLNDNPTIVKSIFEFLTVQFFKNNEGYFIVKNLSHQHLGHLLKLKHPFMVKF